MMILILGIIFLFPLSIGLFHSISHIITILNNPVITLSLFDDLVLFITCVIIGLIILDIVILIDEIEYLL